jgi:2,3-bisphosphoglycerate-independent phosphoglycerate mutase
MTHKKSFLLILDGWGLGKISEVDALQQAKTPVFDSLIEKYPNNTLVTFGEEVGLPEGQMGNSEVGHLNIGAGRIVDQELVRINKACRNKTLVNEAKIQDLIQYSKTNDKPVHLMGLLSDGGVHSHINHLISIVEMLSESGLKNILIHCFMDGRDTAPNGGKKYMSTLLKAIEGKAKVGSIIGRYYAMDRDNRYERIEKAYDLLVKGEGEIWDDPIAAMQDSYDKDLTDEFILPISINHGDARTTINSDDAVLFYNFRTDRPRQITRVLTQEDMPDYEMKKLDLQFFTMTEYDENFKNIHVVFTKDKIAKTIGEVVADHGLTQLRIAETEKYPHVTFFFSGGREAEFKGESRILIPSPKVATYDMQPEMSANEITEKVRNFIDSDKPDFICLNFANTDMVGHTGDFEAAIKAAETVDSCLGQCVSKGLEHDYEIIIIADHGNSDIMKNADGSTHTAHTTNLVPIIYASNNVQGKLSHGKLGDVAVTLLDLMGVPKDELMTGKTLIV